MGSTSPTLLVEANSAWVVIVAVSAVTLPAALVLRRIIGRPGGIASSLLLVLPLATPLVAAMLFAGGVLPEVTMLRPAALSRLMTKPESLLNLLLFADERSGSVAFYTFSGAPGRWLLLLGVAIVCFMLARRLAGVLLVWRLARRCLPLGEDGGEVRAMVEGLSRLAGLKRVPDVLVLPGGACGAFAIGLRRPRILMSQDLWRRLGAAELEAILAHEIAHLESGDMHVMSAAGLLRDVTAWNPVAHVALRLLAADRELEADRRAAVMTGKPLALASGLVKLCELLRTRPRRSYRATLAVLRPRGRVQRRVHRLLALADGNAAPITSRLPYVAAAALVTVIGFQAAATVASLSESRFAIVWGAPRMDESELPSLKELAGNAQRRGDGKAAPADDFRVGPWIKYASTPESGFVLRERDFKAWLRAVKKPTKSPGLSPELRKVTNNRWEAVPLFTDARIGPLGLYRVGRL